MSRSFDIVKLHSIITVTFNNHSQKLPEKAYNCPDELFFLSIAKEFRSTYNETRSNYYQPLAEFLEQSSHIENYQVLASLSWFMHIKTATNSVLNPIALASCGKRYLDSGVQFTAFIYWLLYNDVPPELILSTHLFHAFFQYHATTIEVSQDGCEIKVLVTILESLQKNLPVEISLLLELLHNTKCETRGFEGYSLAGTQLAYIDSEKQADGGLIKHREYLGETAVAAEKYQLGLTDDFSDYESAYQLFGMDFIFATNSECHRQQALLISLILKNTQQFMSDIQLCVSMNTISLQQLFRLIRVISLILKSDNLLWKRADFSTHTFLIFTLIYENSLIETYPKDTKTIFQEMESALKSLLFIHDELNINSAFLLVHLYSFSDMDEIEPLLEEAIRSIINWLFEQEKYTLLQSEEILTLIGELKKFTVTQLFCEKYATDLIHLIGVRCDSIADLPHLSLTEKYELLCNDTQKFPMISLLLNALTFNNSVTISTFIDGYCRQESNMLQAQFLTDLIIKYGADFITLDFTDLLEKMAEDVLLSSSAEASPINQLIFMLEILGSAFAIAKNEHHKDIIINCLNHLMETCPHISALYKEDLSLSIFSQLVMDDNHTYFSRLLNNRTLSNRCVLLCLTVAIDECSYNTVITIHVNPTVNYESCIDIALKHAFFSHNTTMSLFLLQRYQETKISNTILLLSITENKRELTNYLLKDPEAYHISSEATSAILFGHNKLDLPMTSENDRLQIPLTHTKALCLLTGECAPSAESVAFALKRAAFQDAVQDIYWLCEISKVNKPMKDAVNAALKIALDKYNRNAIRYLSALKGKLAPSNQLVYRSMMTLNNGFFKARLLKDLSDTPPQTTNTALSLSSSEYH